MFAKMLDRKHGDWVFLTWQMTLSCVIGTLMCMAFLWQGFVQQGITIALLTVLLCYLINEVLMIKYILALPKDDEESEEEDVKVSENWLSLRKKYNTLDEVSHRYIAVTSSNASKQGVRTSDVANDYTETTAIPMSEMQDYFKRLQDEQAQGIS